MKRRAIVSSPDIASTPRQLFWRSPTIILLVALACLLLIGLRVAAEFSLKQPLHRQTSGCEEEALFSIWKFSQGQTVYADPSAIPFSISYFNWLFYVTYGGVVALALNFLHLDCQWVPNFTRCLTLLFSIGCCGAFYQAARAAAAWPQEMPFVARLGLAIVVAFNPLFGFFNFTTRPDVAAVFFELAGLCLMLRYLKTNQRTAFWSAAMALYVAWAFKQTTINVLAGCMLWFLLRKNFRDFSLLAFTTIVLYAITFAVGGELYLFSVVQSQANCALRISGGLEYFLRASIKFPFLPLILGAVLGERIRMLLFRRKADFTAIELVFIFSLLWSTLTSMKEGASEYYFLPPCVYGAIWLLQAWSVRSMRGENTAWPQRILIAGCALQFLTILPIFAGRAGVISMHAEHVRHQKLADALQEYEAPVLVTERFGNLPWIQRKPPHFLFAYTYLVDRAAGRKYQERGLGGLIAKKYFRTIVVRTDWLGDVAAFDGQPFNGYKRVGTVDSYALYIRMD